MFDNGDKVTINHQPDIGECVVVNNRADTDIIMVGGKAVEYYVIIDTKDAKNQGYHYWNLTKVL